MAQDFLPVLHILELIESWHISNSPWQKVSLTNWCKFYTAWQIWLSEVSVCEGMWLTLLALPLDIISEIPLAASFFSATQRTRRICPRLRIMSASCCNVSWRTLCAAQKYLRWTPGRRSPDKSTDLLRKHATSIPALTWSSRFNGQLQRCSRPILLAC